MIELYLKTLSDLKNPKILWRLFVPFVIAMVLVSLMGYSFFALFLTSDWVMANPVVMEIDQSADQAEQWLANIPLIGGMILWTVTFIITVFIGLVSLIIGSYLILLFAMVITGFMTDSLIKVVRDSHYPQIDYQGHGSFSGMMLKLVGFGLLMLLVILLSLPLLFIPLINVLWVWLIGFLFFRYALMLDVGQVILSAEEYASQKALSNWTPTASLAVLYSLTLLPLISLFAPVIGVIMLAHWMFKNKQSVINK